MKVINSKGEVIDVARDEIPFEHSTITQRAKEMLSFLEKTSKTIKADKSQCVIAIQPFEATDVLFILQKERITDDTVLRNAHNPNYEPASEREGQLLRSIFAVESRDKTEYWQLYLQPIEFEHNLHDGVYTRISPKGVIPYEVFSKYISDMHPYMTDSDYENYKEIYNSDKTKPFLKTGYRFYNEGRLEFDNPKSLLDKALPRELAPNDKVNGYEKLYRDILAYSYQEGITYDVFGMNDATRALYAINQNSKRNIFATYNEVKKILQEYMGESVSNIHYEDSVICFSSKYEPDGKIYVCNRDTVDDKPLFYYNGVDVYGTENLRDWFDISTRGFFKSGWYKEWVEPNIDPTSKELAKMQKAKAWGKVGR